MRSDMNTDRPCRRYSGVTRHAGKWLVKFRHKGQDLNLGHFDDRELAAQVADFARYLLWGLRLGNWPAQAGRPNFPPRAGDDVPRLPILRKLLEARGVKPEILRARLAEYDAVAEGDRGTETAAGAGQH